MTTMKNFTKTGEWQEIDEQDFNDNKREGRSRNIWGPPEALKALPGFVNKLCLKALKKICPSFICGFSTEALSIKLTADKNRLIARHGVDNILTFTFDGSAHDSH